MDIYTILKDENGWNFFLRNICIRYIPLRVGTLYFLKIETYYLFQDILETSYIGTARYNNQYVVFLPQTETQQKPIYIDTTDYSNRLLNLLIRLTFNAHFHKWAHRYAPLVVQRALVLEKTIRYVN